MADNKRLFVAIIGGFRLLQEPAGAAARKMANEVGEALANAGMGLVVYFSDDVSLEPHVVSGFVKALPPGSGERSIRVRFADSQKELVRFKEQDVRPEVFDLNLFAGNDWEAPFYRSLVAADGVDAVLLMAGAQSVLIAGQIALARPLPLLAIDQFEGSAKTIRTELAIAAGDYPSTKTHNTAQLVNWLRDKCLTRVKEQAEARLEEEKLVAAVSKLKAAASQRKKSIWAGVAFAALLIVVFFGVGPQPDPGSYIFLTFIGMIAAGATGALIRSVISGSDESAPIASLVLGGVAGFVAGAACLLPQWVAALKDPAVLTKQIMQTDRIQFVSVVLVAISAGVGFDTVFTRLKKQAEEQPLTIPSK